MRISDWSADVCSSDLHGLAQEPITVRMTGCPNGCARPYIAEIGFSGRAPGKYNTYLGGGFHGQRLNRMIRENVNEATILEVQDEVFASYAKERLDDERFGDFVARAGIVREVTEGRMLHERGQSCCEGPGNRINRAWRCEGT